MAVMRRLATKTNKKNKHTLAATGHLLLIRKHVAVMPQYKYVFETHEGHLGNLFVRYDGKAIKIYKLCGW